MLKQLPLALSALLLFAACQSLEAPGDVMAPSTQVRPVARATSANGVGLKKGKNSDLIVAYTTNNDGEIEPCG